MLSITHLLQYSNILLQYAIYRYSLLAILYYIAVVNIAMYRYIVSPLIESLDVESNKFLLDESAKNIFIIIYN